MSDAPEFGKIVVFGVGLIGGSFALALKAAGEVGEVVGFGRSVGTLKQALELGDGLLNRKAIQRALIAGLPHRATKRRVLAKRM